MTYFKLKKHISPSKLLAIIGLGLLVVIGFLGPDVAKMFSSVGF